MDDDDFEFSLGLFDDELDPDAVADWLDELEHERWCKERGLSTNPDDWS